MNEPPGATVMIDSSGNGLNGVIDPTGTGALDCWEALAVEDPLEVSR
jgi:hypothetical protein